MILDINIVVPRYINRLMQCSFNEYSDGTYTKSPKFKDFVNSVCHEQSLYKGPCELYNPKQYYIVIL